MTTRMYSATKTLCLALAAVLSTMMATGALAADAAPTASAVPVTTTAPSSGPPGEQLEQLDQIVVRGENLLKAIADAEDNFYSLYNKLNKDHDYDTNCVYLQLDSTSLIKNRTCIPGFLADALADWAPFKARCQPPVDGGDEFSCLDRNKDNRLSEDEAAARPELESEFTALDQDMNGYLDRQEFAAHTFSAVAVYQPPAPQLVLMQRSNDWAVHMMKMVNSDPRLKDMAGHLDDLYRELQSVQQKYSKIKEDGMPEKTERRELGPRMH